MCLSTNERYKTYQTGFSFGRLGHAPGVGLGGTVGCRGPRKKIPEIQPNLVCELHEWHMQGHNFLGPHSLGPWGGAKSQILLNLNYKVNFKDF